MSGLLATIHSFLPRFHLIFTPDPSFSLLLSLSTRHRAASRAWRYFCLTFGHFFGIHFEEHFFGTLFGTLFLSSALSLRDPAASRAWRYFWLTSLPRHSFS